MAVRVAPSDITLTVDDREPPSIERLLLDYGFTVVCARMPVGDISFVTPTTERYVGIERKKWGDLIGSVRRMQHGVTPRVSHLHWQAKRMQQMFDISIILLDGLFRPAANGGLRLNSAPILTPEGGLRLPQGRDVAPGAIYQADNALLSLQQRGILVAHCLDSEKLGERIMKIVTWADKGEHHFGNGQRS